MKEIITDSALLETPSEQVLLLSEDGSGEEECRQIIAELQEVFDTNDKIFAVAAPQIGIQKRVFGIKFDDTIKYFINPIVTKKLGLTVAPETCLSLPGKEILIGRPDEITAIYYTKDFKYEDNKLLGSAARVFDQMTQLLDGILPSELGLVSDVATDGSLDELSEEEIAEVTEVWKKYVKVKLEAAEKEINSDKNIAKIYNHLRFTESVINGRTQVIEEPTKKKLDGLQKNAVNNANLKQFLRSKK